MKPVAAAVLTLVLVPTLAGCGGGGLTAEQKQTAKSFETYMSTNSQGLITKKQAHCIGTDFATHASQKDLRAAKVIDDKGVVDFDKSTFTPDLSGQFADSYLKCYDYVKAQVDAAIKQRPDLKKQVYSDCLTAALPRQDVRALIIGGLTKKPDTATIEKAQAAGVDCLNKATPTN